jgi:hypothetical protein
VSPIEISWIVFACIFGGATLGMFLRSRLPENHLNSDSKDVIKLAMGVLGTMAALVLALLINSAKSSHDVQSGEITQMAADFILLDRVLAHYGPEGDEARGLLRTAVAGAIDDTWRGRDYRSNLDSRTTRARADSFFEKIQQLQPRNDYQRSLNAQALQICSELGRLRSLLLEQTQGSIPMPFLIVLVFWLTVIFTGFGLFSRPNPTVVGVLLLSSISIAGAIFLVLELDRPFEGLIQISNAPLRNAVAHLGK